ncbi:hypothetical protein BDN70DRAFT_993970 [Pholiota conissans]|uniref:Uncharacterized protein n=1 Tax=Pholiota conissans TaxID=109636 RepID=A0A9P6D0L7_9AGAR|nr:hypothetical protein BDN70DRAFT_993970 [Pholiota conissans]
MASDSSDSPLVLTPESTGTGTSSNGDPIGSVPNTPATKKARRQTAFYPNSNGSNKPVNPFSKSAAKRESVMALGSITHLQHYFTKTGLAAKKNPLNKPHHGLVPAIGGLQIPTSPAQLSSIADEFEIQLPPSPLVPPPVSNPAFAPHVKMYEVDPESLLPGVIEDVVAVAHAWKLESPSMNPDIDLDVPFNVLEVLKTTTRAIRSTRNYLLSLPDESAGTIRSNFRPHLLGPTRNLNRTSSNSSLSAAAAAAAAAPTPPPQHDPITLIRRGALEVLTVLRQLEESCRLPLEDEAYDARSDGGKSGGTASSPSQTALELAPPHALELERSSSSLGAGTADMSISLVQVQGRFESVLVWEDEDDGFGVEEEETQRHRERWDDRLGLGTGWLYRQDVRLDHLRKERAVVGKYLDLVDEVMFEGKKEDGENPGQSVPRERGWEQVRKKREGRASSRAAKNRRVSAGVVAREAEASRTEEARRRVSTGMINNIMRGMSLSEEPEELMDGIREEDDDEGAYRGRPWDREVVEEEEIDDEDLPAWARRSEFADNPLGRAHALLETFLPAPLRTYLVSPEGGARTAFLSSLSSGQLLCGAYNACVRKSKRPWGFVSPNGVHDIIALEKAAIEAAKAGKDKEKDGSKEKDGAMAKKAWTFRRTDNLRLWAGALKLRYSMPIQVPSQVIPTTSSSLQPLAGILASVSSSSTSTPSMSTSSASLSVTSTAPTSTTSTPLPSPGATARFGSNVQGLARAKADREPPIMFDARLIAKKEEGWETMLESVLVEWVERAVRERRVFVQ